MAPPPLSPDAERRLVRAVLAGKPGAFVRLVQQYERLVAHVVYALVPEADRADLCQDVFVRVYEHLAGFRFESRLSTWIARIATTTGLKHIEKRHPALLDDLGNGDEAPDEGLLERVPSSQPAPDVVAGEALRAEAVRAAVARLPVPYRAVLTLFHLEDRSYDEVAEATGMPLGTVKNYLFRARRLLKEQLLAARRAEDWT